MVNGSKLDMAPTMNRHARRVVDAMARGEKTRELRVLVAFPSGEYVCSDFTLAYAALVAMTPNNVVLANAKSSLVMRNRNLIAHMAQQAGCTHVLYVDSDMIFPRDALIRLLSHTKDIVGATYVRRAVPTTIIGRRAAGELLSDSGLPEQEGLIEMAEMPFGMMLVKVSVFDTIERPYFFLGHSDEHEGGIVAEDVDWCRRVCEAGHQVWCDARLSREMQHIGTHVFTVAEAEWQQQTFGKPEVQRDDQAAIAETLASAEAAAEVTGHGNG